MAYAAFVNADLVTQARGAIVRTGATGQCLLAQADTLAHVANLLGTRLADVLTTASGQIGAFDEPGQLIRMDAAPAVGAVVYVSAATPGVGTTTKPAIAVPVGICYEATNVAGVDYAAVTPIVPGSTPGTLSGGTLASSYLAGASAADQTISLADANGGGVVVDATSAGFTGANALVVNGAGGSVAAFPRVGGLSVASSISRAAGAGTAWDEVAFLASTITLTGGPTTVNALSMITIGAGTITSGTPNTVKTAASLTIAGPPTATGVASITNRYAAWVQAGTIASFNGITDNGLLGGLGTTYNAVLQADVSSFGQLLISSMGNNASTGLMSFYKSRSGDGVTSVILQNGDSVGTIIYYGDNGASVARQLATIAAVVDGVPAAGSMPGMLTFSTTKQGDAAPTTRMTINNLGNVLVGTSVDVNSSRLQLQSDFTIAAPIAGDTWKGINYKASTLTLTAGGTAPSSLSAAYFAAPTITQTAGAAYTIPVAATLTIAGPPAAAGGATLTSPRALDVLSGASYFQDIHVNIASTGGWTFYTGFNGSGGAGVYMGTGGGNVFLGSSDSSWIQLVTNNVPRLAVTPTNGNIRIGTILNSDDAATRLCVVASKTIASAAGAVWDGIKFAADTLTISGGPGTITALSKFLVEGPTITSAAANVTTDFYTARLGIATFTGAGPASATRNWSLYVEGNLRLGGGVVVPGKQILIGASPYPITQNDYALEVQSNGGAITVTLPALTGGTVLNGRIYLIIDSGYSAAGANITVALGNGADKINNVNANYLINSNGAALRLKANTTNNNWEIV